MPNSPISRRGFLTQSLAIAGAAGHAALAARPTARAAATERPNIVLIFTDDAGYADFGCYGSDDFRTPNIDALAAEGVRCTQGYVSCSVCGPSRAGLITGRYQQRFGFEYNNVPGAIDPHTNSEPEDWGLPVEETTFADALDPRGYRSMIIGKWHLGHQDKYHPLNRGFDEFYGFLGGARSFFPYKGEPPGPEYRMMRDWDVVEDPAYATDAFTREAVDFIGRNREHPFFLYLAYNAVHTPLHAKPEDRAVYEGLEPRQRETLGGMTKALDEGVGAVCDALAEHGLAENTLVFFINDNGGETQQIKADNGILSGCKGTKYEGGIRVPFIVRWPDRLPAGAVYEQPVSTLDVFPTMLRAAGGDPDRHEQLDGVDLVPYLAGERDGRPHETLFWRKGLLAAVRHGDWKLLRHPDKPAELFNIEADPSEIHDRAAEHPAIVRDLYARLWEWEQSLARPRWMIMPKYDSEAVQRGYDYRHEA